MTNKQIIKLLLSYAKNYKLTASLMIINTILTVLVNSFIAPLFLSQIFSQLQTGTIKLATSWSLIAGYALAQIYGILIGWRVTLWLCWRFETKIQAKIYSQVFDKIINESIDFHSNKFGGSLVSQINKFAHSFEALWDNLVWNLIPAFVTIISTVLILSFSFWQYAIFIAVIAMAFIGVVMSTSKFLAKHNKLETQASTKLTGMIADAIGNIAIVKSNGQEAYELARIEHQADDWRAKSLSVMRGAIGTSSIYSSLNTTLTILALVSAIVASEYQWISIGMVYLILTYTLQVTRELWSVTSIMRNYYSIIGNASEMAEILTTETKLVDQSTKRLRVKKGAVEFKNISYTYESGAGVNIFDQFNLKIPAGQRVGIVGRSGSGKTSLTRILLRFSDVSDGAVLIDNQDIAKVSQESLHKSIAYVPQESSLFHRSIRDNIAYGKPEASEVEIIASAKEANAWEFISKLPDGLDTMVGERGVKLSGGQRQRIAIARAILKNSPILVLDEATSALDSESEKLIQDSLDNLMKNRTSLVIAHRLSTIAKLDRIIVLDQGQIVEDDTHDQLIKQKGIYAKLWHHQSGGFIESEE